jgi:uncharacterized RDD family membrane protein YckC
MTSTPSYAGFWIRTLATLIDSLLIYGMIYTILWLFLKEGAFASELALHPLRILLEWIVPMCIAIGFWHIKGATPGKMLLGLRVVDADTLQAVELPRLIGRYFAYFLGIFTFFLGFLWVAWDKKKQGIHDKAMRTVVIRDKNRPSPDHPR